MYGYKKHYLECVIDGVRQTYDACSSNDLDSAIAYYDNFKYIGSNTGIIYVNSVKNDFKCTHHFFNRLNSQELRMYKLMKILNKIDNDKR